MSGKWETIHKYLQPSLIAGMLCGKSPGLQALNAYCRGVCVHVYVCTCVPQDMNVGVRGQLVTLGSRNQLRVARLGGRCLYLLTHLTGADFCLLPEKA